MKTGPVNLLAIEGKHSVVDFHPLGLGESFRQVSEIVGDFFVYICHQVPAPVIKRGVRFHFARVAGVFLKILDILLLGGDIGKIFYRCIRKAYAYKSSLLIRELCD